MFKHTLLVAALLPLFGGVAAADPEIEALRGEIRQMREAYEARLAELESA